MADKNLSLNLDLGDFRKRWFGMEITRVDGPESNPSGFRLEGPIEYLETAEQEVGRYFYAVTDREHLSGPGRETYYAYEFRRNETAAGQSHQGPREAEWDSSALENEEDKESGARMAETLRRPEAAQRPKDLKVLDSSLTSSAQNDVIGAGARMAGGRRIIGLSGDSFDSITLPGVADFLRQIPFRYRATHIAGVVVIDKRNDRLFGADQVSQIVKYLKDTGASNFGLSVDFLKDKGWVVAIVPSYKDHVIEFDRERLQVSRSVPGGMRLSRINPIEISQIAQFLDDLKATPGVSRYPNPASISFKHAGREYFISLFEDRLVVRATDFNQDPPQYRGIILQDEDDHDRFASTRETLNNKPTVNPSPEQGAPARLPSGGRMAAEGAANEINLFWMAIRQAVKSARKIHLDERILRRILTPHRVLEAHFPVKLDDGTTRTFYGNRVLFGGGRRGAGKGGIRFAPTRNPLKLAKGLSLEMLFKAALQELLFDGAKGVVEAEKDRKYSPKEKARSIRKYHDAMEEEAAKRSEKAYGPFVDVPAGDIGTGDEEDRSEGASRIVSYMGAFADAHLQWQSAHGEIDLAGVAPSEDPRETAFLDRAVQMAKDTDGFRTESFGVVTGKPVAKRGSILREEATGIGVFFTAAAWLKYVPQGTLDRLGFHDRRIKGKTVTIQAVGHVGMPAAQAFAEGTELEEGGALVTGASDFWGTVANEDGLNVRSLRLFHRHMREKLDEFVKAGNKPEDFRQKAKEFAGQFDFGDSTRFSDDRNHIFEIPSDFFIPAFDKDQINGRNVDLIAGTPEKPGTKKAIFEAANGPTTSKADDVLKERNVPVLPDILVNGGGVTVSYFEWIQNISDEEWKSITVEQLLREGMFIHTKEVVELAHKKVWTYREAAYVIALKRLADAELGRDESLRQQFSPGKLPYDDYDPAIKPETIEEMHVLTEDRNLFGKLAVEREEKLTREIQSFGEEILKRIREGQDIRYVLVGGPPVAGKTFIAEALKEYLIKHGAKAIYLSDSKTSLADYVRDHPREDAIIVAEGSNVFSKDNLGVAPRERRYGIFVNAVPRFKLRDNRPLTASDILLFLDVLYRSKDLRGRPAKIIMAIHAIDQWVSRRKHMVDEIYPQRKDADVFLNSYLSIELPILRPALEDLLSGAEDILSDPNLGEALKDLRSPSETLRTVDRVLDLIRQFPAVEAEGIVNASSPLSQYIDTAGTLIEEIQKIMLALTQDQKNPLVNPVWYDATDLLYELEESLREFRSKGNRPSADLLEDAKEFVRRLSPARAVSAEARGHAAEYHKRVYRRLLRLLGKVESGDAKEKEEAVRELTDWQMLSLKRAPQVDGRRDDPVRAIVSHLWIDEIYPSKKQAILDFLLHTNPRVLKHAAHFLLFVSALPRAHNKFHPTELLPRRAVAFKLLLQLIQDANEISLKNGSESWQFKSIRTKLERAARSDAAKRPERYRQKAGEALQAIDQALGDNRWLTYAPRKATRAASREIPGASFSVRVSPLGRESASSEGAVVEVMKKGRVYFHFDILRLAGKSLGETADVVAGTFRANSRLLAFMTHVASEIDTTQRIGEKGRQRVSEGDLTTQITDADSEAMRLVERALKQHASGARMASELISELSPLTAGNPHGARMGEGKLSYGTADISSWASGAFTGQVSAAMLRDAGASFVLIQEPRRSNRKNVGEDNRDIALKIRQAVFSESGAEPMQAITTLNIPQEYWQKDSWKNFLGNQMRERLGFLRHHPEKVERVWLVPQVVDKEGRKVLLTASETKELHEFVRSRKNSNVKVLLGGQTPEPQNIEPYLAVSDGVVTDAETALFLADRAPPFVVVDMTRLFGKAAEEKAEEIKQKLQNTHTVLISSAFDLRAIGQVVTGHALYDISPQDKPTPLFFGVQDLEDESPEYLAALRSAGITHVLLGHSEVRRYHDVTDGDVARQAKAVSDAGLIPIIAVGEKNRLLGRWRSVLAGQVKTAVSLLTLEQINNAIFAYEPVAYIGSGQNMSTLEMAEASLIIQNVISDIAPGVSARILYGGSEKPSSSYEHSGGWGMTTALQSLRRLFLYVGALIGTRSLIIGDPDRIAERFAENALAKGKAAKGVTGANWKMNVHTLQDAERRVNGFYSTLKKSQWLGDFVVLAPAPLAASLAAKYRGRHAPLDVRSLPWTARQRATNRAIHRFLTWWEDNGQNSSVESLRKALDYFFREVYQNDAELKRFGVPWYRLFRQAILSNLFAGKNVIQAADLLISLRYSSIDSVLSRLRGQESALAPPLEDLLGSTTHFHDLGKHEIGRLYEALSAYFKLSVYDREILRSVVPPVEWARPVDNKYWEGKLEENVRLLRGDGQAPAVQRVLAYRNLEDISKNAQINPDLRRRAHGAMQSVEHTLHVVSGNAALDSSQSTAIRLIERLRQVTLNDEERSQLADLEQAVQGISADLENQSENKIDEKLKAVELPNHVELRLLDDLRDLLDLEGETFEDVNLARFWGGIKAYLAHALKMEKDKLVKHPEAMKVSGPYAADRSIGEDPAPQTQPTPKNPPVDVETVIRPLLDYLNRFFRIKNQVIQYSVPGPGQNLRPLGSRPLTWQTHADSGATFAQIVLTFGKKVDKEQLVKALRYGQLERMPFRYAENFLPSADNVETQDSPLVVDANMNVMDEGGLVTLHVWVPSWAQTAAARLAVQAPKRIGLYGGDEVVASEMVRQLRGDSSVVLKYVYIEETTENPLDVSSYIILLKQLMPHAAISRGPEGDTVVINGSSPIRVYFGENTIPDWKKEGVDTVVVADSRNFSEDSQTRDEHLGRGAKEVVFAVNSDAAGQVVQAMIKEILGGFEQITALHIQNNAPIDVHAEAIHDRVEERQRVPAPFANIVPRSGDGVLRVGSAMHRANLGVVTAIFRSPVDRDSVIQKFRQTAKVRVHEGKTPLEPGLFEGQTALYFDANPSDILVQGDTVTFVIGYDQTAFWAKQVLEAVKGPASNLPLPLVTDKPVSNKESKKHFINREKEIDDLPAPMSRRIRRESGQTAPIHVAYDVSDVSYKSQERDPLEYLAASLVYWLSGDERLSPSFYGVGDVVSFYRSLVKRLPRHVRVDLENFNGNSGYLLFDSEGKKARVRVFKESVSEEVIRRDSLDALVVLTDKRAEERGALQGRVSDYIGTLGLSSVQVVNPFTDLYARAKQEWADFLREAVAGESRIRTVTTAPLKSSEYRLSVDAPRQHFTVGVPARLEGELHNFIVEFEQPKSRDEILNLLKRFQLKLGERMQLTDEEIVSMDLVNNPHEFVASTAQVSGEERLWSIPIWTGESGLARVILERAVVQGTGSMRQRRAEDQFESLPPIRPWLPKRVLPELAGHGRKAGLLFTAALGRTGKQMLWQAMGDPNVGILGITLNKPTEEKVIASARALNNDTVYGEAGIRFEYGGWDNDKKVFVIWAGGDAIGWKRLNVYNGKPESIPEKHIAEWRAKGYLPILLHVAGSGYHRFKEKEWLERGFAAVVYGTPGKAENLVLVPGLFDLANSETVDLIRREEIFSLGSCTSDAVAAAAVVFKDVAAYLTGVTRHEATNDQNVNLGYPIHDVDERMLPGTNTVLSSSGAGTTVAKIISELAGRGTFVALREGYGGASEASVVMKLKKDSHLTVEMAKQRLREAADGPLKGILAVHDKPYRLDSEEVKGNLASGIVDLNSVQIIDDYLVLDVGYDNEAAFSRRMVELGEMIAIAKASRRGARLAAGSVIVQRIQNAIEHSSVNVDERKKIFQIAKTLLSYGKFYVYDQVQEGLLGYFVRYGDIEHLREIARLVVRSQISGVFARRVAAVVERIEAGREEAFEERRLYDAEHHTNTLPKIQMNFSGVLEALRALAKELDPRSIPEDQDREFAKSIAIGVVKDRERTVSETVKVLKEQIEALAILQDDRDRDGHYRKRVRHLYSHLVRLTFSNDAARQIQLMNLMTETAILNVRESAPLLVYLIASFLRYGYAVEEENFGPVIDFMELANAATEPGIRYLLRLLGNIVFAGNSGQQDLKVDDPERVKTRSGSYGVGIRGVIRDETHNYLGIHCLGLLERQLEYYRRYDGTAEKEASDAVKEILYSPKYEPNVFKNKTLVPKAEGSRFRTQIVHQLHPGEDYEASRFIQALYRHVGADPRRNFYEMLRSMTDAELEGVIQDINLELGTDYRLVDNSARVNVVSYLWTYRALAGRYSIGNWQQILRQFQRVMFANSPFYMESSVRQNLDAAIRAGDFARALGLIVDLRSRLKQAMETANPSYNRDEIINRFHLERGRDDSGNAIGGAQLEDRKLQTYQADYYLSLLEYFLLDEVSRRYAEITDQNYAAALAYIKTLAMLGYLNGDYTLGQVDHANVLNSHVDWAKRLDVMHLMMREVNQLEAFYQAAIRPTLSRMAPETFKEVFGLETALQQMKDINRVNRHMKRLLERLRKFRPAVGILPGESKPAVSPRERFVVLGPNSSQEEITRALQIGRYYLGAKGMGLIRALQLGIPVPPFAIFSNELTSADIELLLPEVMRQIDAAVKGERNMGLGSWFANHERPYYLAVRASTYLTMPGQTTTITNIGMAQGNLGNFIGRLGRYGIEEDDAVWTAWDSYRRFLESYATAVFGMRKEDFDVLIEGYKKVKGVTLKEKLTGDQMRELALSYLAKIREMKGAHSISDDPMEQLRSSIDAVKESFVRAKPYLEARNIRADWPGASVILQVMAYGNIRNRSGSAVVYTRDPNTWIYGMNGDFKSFAQGEDLADPVTHPLRYEDLPHEIWQDSVTEWGDHLEKLTGANAQMETTIQNINGQPTPWLVQERETYIPDITPVFVTKPRVRDILFEARGSSGGAFRGMVAYQGDKIPTSKELQRLSADGVVMIVDYLDPEDAPQLIRRFKMKNIPLAVVSRRGGYASHTSDIARELGVTAVVDASGLAYSSKSGLWMVGNRPIRRGDRLSVDGRTGIVARGFLRTDRDTQASGARMAAAKTAWVKDYVRGRLEKLPMDERGKMIRESWSGVVQYKNRPVMTALSTLSDAEVKQETLERLIDVLMALGVDVQNPWSTAYLISSIVRHMSKRLLGEDLSHFKPLVHGREVLQLTPLEVQPPIAVSRDGRSTLRGLRREYGELRDKMQARIISKDNYHSIAREISGAQNEFVEKVLRRLLAIAWRELGIRENTSAAIYFREMKSFGSDLDFFYWGPKAYEVNIKLTELLLLLGFQRDLFSTLLISGEINKRHIDFDVYHYFFNGVKIDINKKGYFDEFYESRVKVKADPEKMWRDVYPYLCRQLAVWNKQPLDADFQLPADAVDFKRLQYRAVTNLLFGLSVKFDLPFGPDYKGFFEELRTHMDPNEFDALTDAMDGVNQLRNLNHTISRRSWEHIDPEVEGRMQRFIPLQGIPDLAELGSKLDAIREKYFGQPQYRHTPYLPLFADERAQRAWKKTAHVYQQIIQEAAQQKTGGARLAEFHDISDETSTRVQKFLMSVFGLEGQSRDFWRKFNDFFYPLKGPTAESALFSLQFLYRHSRLPMTAEIINALGVGNPGNQFNWLEKRAGGFFRRLIRFSDRGPKNRRFFRVRLPLDPADRPWMLFVQRAIQKGFYKLSGMNENRYQRSARELRRFLLAPGLFGSPEVLTKFLGFYHALPVRQREILVFSMAYQYRYRELPLIVEIGDSLGLKNRQAVHDAIGWIMKKSKAHLGKTFKLNVDEGTYKRARNVFIGRRRAVSSEETSWMERALEELAHAGARMAAGSEGAKEADAYRVRFGELVILVRKESDGSFRATIHNALTMAFRSSDFSQEPNGTNFIPPSDASSMSSGPAVILHEGPEKGSVPIQSFHVRLDATRDQPLEIPLPPTAGSSAKEVADRIVKAVQSNRSAGIFAEHLKAAVLKEFGQEGGPLGARMALRRGAENRALLRAIAEKGQPVPSKPTTKSEARRGARMAAENTGQPPSRRDFLKKAALGAGLVGALAVLLLYRPKPRLLGRPHETILNKETAPWRGEESSHEAEVSIDLSAYPAGDYLVFEFEPVEPARTLFGFELTVEDDHTKNPSRYSATFHAPFSLNYEEVAHGRDYDLARSDKEKGLTAFGEDTIRTEDGTRVFQVRIPLSDLRQKGINSISKARLGHGKKSSFGVSINNQNSGNIKSGPRIFIESPVYKAPARENTAEGARMARERIVDRGLWMVGNKQASTIPNPLSGLSGARMAARTAKGILSGLRGQSILVLDSLYAGQDSKYGALYKDRKTSRADKIRGAFEMMAPSQTPIVLASSIPKAVAALQDQPKAGLVVLNIPPRRHQKALDKLGQIGLLAEKYLYVPGTHYSNPQIEVSAENLPERIQRSLKGVSVSAKQATPSPLNATQRRAVDRKARIFVSVASKKESTIQEINQTLGFNAAQTGIDLKELASRDLLIQSMKPVEVAYGQDLRRSFALPKAFYSLSERGLAVWEKALKDRDPLPRVKSEIENTAASGARIADNRNNVDGGEGHSTIYHPQSTIRAEGALGARMADRSDRRRRRLTPHEYKESLRRSADHLPSDLTLLYMQTVNKALPDEVTLNVLEHYRKNIEHLISEIKRHADKVPDGPSRREADTLLGFSMSRLGTLLLKQANILNSAGHADYQGAGILYELSIRQFEAAEGLIVDKGVINHQKGYALRGHAVNLLKQAQLLSPYTDAQKIAEAFKLLGDANDKMEEAVKLLSDKLSPNGTDWIFKDITAQTEQVRAAEETLNAGARLAATQAESIRISRIVSSWDPDFQETIDFRREYAVRALRDIGPEPDKKKEFFEAMLERIRGPEPISKIRELAIESVGRLGPFARSATQDLLQVLRNKEALGYEYLAPATANALRAIGAGSEEEREKALAVLRGVLGNQTEARASNSVLAPLRRAVRQFRLPLTEDLFSLKRYTVDREEKGIQTPKGPLYVRFSNIVRESYVQVGVHRSSPDVGDILIEPAEPGQVFSTYGRPDFRKAMLLEGDSFNFFVDGKWVALVHLSEILWEESPAKVNLSITLQPGYGFISGARMASNLESAEQAVLKAREVVKDARSALEIFGYLDVARSSIAQARDLAVQLVEKPGDAKLQTAFSEKFLEARQRTRGLLDYMEGRPASAQSDFDIKTFLGFLREADAALGQEQKMIASEEPEPPKEPGKPAVGLAEEAGYSPLPSVPPAARLAETLRHPEAAQRPKDLKVLDSSPTSSAQNDVIGAGARMAEASAKATLNFDMHARPAAGVTTMFQLILTLLQLDNLNISYQLLKDGNPVGDELLYSKFELAMDTRLETGSQIMIYARSTELNEEILKLIAAGIADVISTYREMARNMTREEVRGEREEEKTEAITGYGDAGGQGRAKRLSQPIVEQESRKQSISPFPMERNLRVSERDAGASGFASPDKSQSSQPRQLWSSPHKTPQANPLRVSSSNPMEENPNGHGGAALRNNRRSSPRSEVLQLHPKLLTFPPFFVSPVSQENTLTGKNSQLAGARLAETSPPLTKGRDRGGNDDVRTLGIHLASAVSPGLYPVLFPTPEGGLLFAGNTVLVGYGITVSPAGKTVTAREISLDAILNPQSVVARLAGATPVLDETFTRAELIRAQTVVIASPAAAPLATLGDRGALHNLSFWQEGRGATQWQGLFKALDALVAGAAPGTLFSLVLPYEGVANNLADAKQTVLRLDAYARSKKIIFDINFVANAGISADPRQKISGVTLEALSTRAVTVNVLQVADGQTIYGSYLSRLASSHIERDKIGRLVMGVPLPDVQDDTRWSRIGYDQARRELENRASIFGIDRPAAAENVYSMADMIFAGVSAALGNNGITRTLYITYDTVTLRGIRFFIVRAIVDAEVRQFVLSRLATQRAA